MYHFIFIVILDFGSFEIILEVNKAQFSHFFHFHKNYLKAKWKSRKSERTDVLEIGTDFVRFLLTYSLEVRRKILVLFAVESSVFPVWFCYFHRSVSDVFVVHFFQRIKKVFWLLERYESISFGLPCSFVNHNFTLLEGIVLVSKHCTEDFICHFVA